MQARPIVRDPDVYEGRWRIADTLVFVSDIQADHRRSGDAIRPPYHALGISDAEIEAALAFTFPPVLEAPSIEVRYIGLTVHCVCGVKRQATAVGPELETDVCTCGRTWRLPVTIEPGAGGVISDSSRDPRP